MWKLLSGNYVEDSEHTFVVGWEIGSHCYVITK